jgi:hypothetical protein
MGQSQSKKTAQHPSSKDVSSSSSRAAFSAAAVAAQNTFFKAENRKSNKVLSAYYKEITSIPEVSKLEDLNIENQNRFISVTNPDASDFAGMLGNTYKTTNPRNIKKAYSDTGELNPAHVFDAVYACNLDDNKGSVIAVADGCAGHHGDERQDEAIAYLAGYAAKRAGQAMAQFKSNEVAYANTSQVANAVSDYLRQGFRQKKQGKFASFVSENTTLACARIELQDEHLDVTGFNIGDTMIVGWNPVTKQFVTLSPGRTMVTSSKAMYPACIPNELYEGEVQSFRKVLSKDFIIFGLTDFATTHLPVIVTEGQVNERKGYEDVELNPDVMKEILKAVPVDASIDAYNKAIVAACIESNKQAITDKFANSGYGADTWYTEGDDVGLIGYRRGPR